MSIDLWSSLAYNAAIKNLYSTGTRKEKYIMAANFVYSTREHKFILKEWLDMSKVFGQGRFEGGYSLDEVDSILENAMKIAKEVGFPLIIKAAFGGGGRGMRVVENEKEFLGKLDDARREAGMAFGNDAVFLERYIKHAKHIEVQLLGDTLQRQGYP